MIGTVILAMNLLATTLLHLHPSSILADWNFEKKRKCGFVWTPESDPKLHKLIKPHQDWEDQERQWWELSCLIIQYYWLVYLAVLANCCCLVKNCFYNAKVGETWGDKPHVTSTNGHVEWPAENWFVWSDISLDVALHPKIASSTTPQDTRIQNEKKT